MFFAIYQFLDTLLDLFLWVIIINAVLSWLIAFNVVNTSNRIVYSVIDLSYRLTEPVLRPLRRVIPPMGGLDLSPLILYLGLSIIGRRVLLEIFRPLF
jgi:YggT family protein